MATRSTRKRLLALAALLGVGTGVVKWQELSEPEASPSTPELCPVPTVDPGVDYCPPCGRGFAPEASRKFLDAYTAEEGDE